MCVATASVYQDGPGRPRAETADHGPREGGSALLGEGHEQAARRLRIARQEAIGLIEAGAEVGVRSRQLEVREGAARDMALVDQLPHTGKQLDRREIDLGPQPGAVCDLAGVADEAEPGHVGDGMRAGAPYD